jgi:hypothetical protein
MAGLSAMAGPAPSRGGRAQGLSIVSTQGPNPSSGRLSQGKGLSHPGRGSSSAGRGKNTLGTSLGLSKRSTSGKSGGKGK